MFRLRAKNDVGKIHLSLSPCMDHVNPDDLEFVENKLL